MYVCGYTRIGLSGFCAVCAVFIFVVVLRQRKGVRYCGVFKFGKFLTHNFHSVVVGHKKIHKSPHDKLFIYG